MKALNMKPHTRTGSLNHMITDRFANGPDFNEEHTAASVNELYQTIVQILVDSAPGVFRGKLIRSLPAYQILRGQRHRHQWEKKMKDWQKMLSKSEKLALFDKTLICWTSIGRSPESDTLKAIQRLVNR
jgi:predicted  nucleic acid-binding Zn ribbon protein